MSHQFIRYLLVGTINTVFGYVIIFLAMYILGWSPVSSNTLGYSIALLISFVLNRTFTFKSTGRQSSELLKFIAVFIFAFGANLVVLYVSIKFLLIHEAASQIIAGIFYVIISYLMNKYLVFHSESD